MNPFIHDPSPRDLDDARSALRHVGELASAALGISRDREQVCETSDDLNQRLQLMQYLVDRMGWVADVGLRKLGDGGSLARAEDWMLPTV